MFGTCGTFVLPSPANCTNISSPFPPQPLPSHPLPLTNSWNHSSFFLYFASSTLTDPLELSHDMEEDPDGMLDHTLYGQTTTIVVPSGAAQSTPEGIDLKVVVELYIISVLIVLGLVGNVVSVIVLRKDRERRDVLFLLQALALADALYLAAALLRYPLKYVLPEPRYVLMQPVVFPLLKTFQTVAIWMVVLVTVDRFTCVCRPMEAPRLFNPPARRRYAVVVFVAGFLYNVPRYFDSCVYRWVVPPCVGTHVVYRMTYRETFGTHWYYDVYVDGLYTVLLYVAPLSTLVYMNCRLVQAIRYSRQRYHCQQQQHLSCSSRNKWISTNVLHGLPPIHGCKPLPGPGGGAYLPDSPAVHKPPSKHPSHLPAAAALTSPCQTTTVVACPSTDKNATVVLITIVIVFVVCESPELVIKLVSFSARNFATQGHFTPGFVRVLSAVSELLMVINSFVNFLVYLAFGRRFRRILRETFRFSFRFSSNATALTRETAPQGALHHNCVHAHGGGRTPGPAGAAASGYETP